MKKKLSIIIAALICAQNVSAAVVTRNSDGNILISGSLGEEYKNTEVQIQLLGPFAEKKAPAEAVFSGNALNPVFMNDTYINALKTDDEGNYNLIYKIAEEGKYYLAMINEPGKDSVQTVNIYAASAELETAFLTAVNGADKAAMLEILKNPDYKDILSGNRSDFDLITDEKLLERLARGLSENRTYAGLPEFENMLTILCAVQLTNTLSDASEAKSLAEEKLDLTASGLIETYNSFDNEVKTRVFGRMLNSSFEDFEDYMAGFDEGVFLEKVKMQKYASNMTALINDNAQRFGFELNSYSRYADTVNKALYGQDFDDMDAFKRAFAAAISSASSGNGNSGGSGGSGGSGSTGGSGSENIIMATGNPTKTDVPQVTGYFDDIGGVSWAEEAINALAEKGVVSGKADRMFYPQDNIKREEFVRIAVNAFKLTAEETADMNFDDVDADAWYYNDIKTAYSLGIISGTNENSFGVGELITREDMAAILYRTAGILGKILDADEEIFSDHDEISDYAKAAVYSLKKEGVINGIGENTFSPKKNATRAEAARMIFVMTEALK